MMFIIEEKFTKVKLFKTKQQKTAPFKIKLK